MAESASTVNLGIALRRRSQRGSSMIKVGQQLDVSFDSPHGQLRGRCIVISSKRWTLELQSIDLPMPPREDTMIRSGTATGTHTATVQRSDRTTFEILRPPELHLLSAAPTDNIASAHR
jgi:hypothetical protein